MIRHRSTILFLGLTLSIPFVVSAIGVSATPATLSVKTEVGKEGVTRFFVSNPSKEVGLFEAFPEEFETFIVVIPSRFILEAGEKREVLVRATRREMGVIRTAIAIEAQPLGTPSLGIGGGVRLPFLLEVVPAEGLFSAVSLSGAGAIGGWLLLGALTVLFLFRRVSLYTLKRATRRDTL